MSEGVNPFVRANYALVRCRVTSLPQDQDFAKDAANLSCHRATKQTILRPASAGVCFMKLTRVLLSSAAVIVMAGAAQAADLIVMDAAPMAVAPAAHDWSGPYVGVNVGGGMGTVDWTGNYFFEDDTLAGTDEGAFDMSGWTIGVNAGANAQFGNFVLGIDGDIDWTNISGEGPASDSSDIIADLDWMASLRAKAGVAMDNVLIYGTAGVAFAGGTFTITDLDNGTDDRTEDSNPRGWTAGVGAEVALDDNLSVRAEYRYTSLVQDDITYGDIGLNGPALDDRLEAGGTLGIHSVKIGLNYSF
jgi:outer membrane immunogenic protein